MRYREVAAEGCDQAVCLLLLQVKADKDSSNLRRLQQASRGVTQATAAVVASTKSGKSQIEDTGERSGWNCWVYKNTGGCLLHTFWAKQSSRSS